ncbi:unnamed protein product [Rotaria socialis]
MTDNEYRPQVSVRCVECGEVLLKSSDAKCSISCDSNGKYRSYSKDEVEIQERQSDFINEIRKLPASGTTITPTMVEKLLEEFKIPPADN